MKYTFLLPAYKGKYFAESLRSIKNQKYTDFSCLVSDDCSQEDLKCIFDTVIGDDSRFIFRRNEKNLGGKSLTAHWNLLVDMCQSEYLIMASDDDVYEPEFLTEIDKLTVKYPEVDVLKGRTKSIDVNGNILYQDSEIAEHQSIYEHLLSKYEHTYIQGIPQFVFKTAKLKEIGNFPEYPDACYSDDASVMMCAENGICTTPQIVFGFRTSYINLSSQMAPAVARKKIAADKQFDVWMNKWLNSYQDPYLELKDRVISGLRKHVYNHFMDHYYLVTIAEIFTNYLWAVRSGYLNCFNKRIHYLFFFPLLKFYRLLRNHNLAIGSNNRTLIRVRNFALGR